jgi:hypothetical protein
MISVGEQHLGEFEVAMLVQSLYAERSASRIRVGVRSEDALLLLPSLWENEAPAATIEAATQQELRSPGHIKI